MTNQTNLPNRWKAWTIKNIILTAVIIVVILSISVNEYFKYNKKMFCYIENYIDVDGNKLKECMMFQVKGDTRNIGMQKFELKGGVCKTKFDKLPRCNGSNYYYSVFPIKAMCDNCSNKGNVCMGSWVSYYNVKKSYADVYTSKYIGYVDTEWELISLIKKCDGDKIELV